MLSENQNVSWCYCGYFFTCISISVSISILSLEIMFLFLWKIRENYFFKIMFFRAVRVWCYSIHLFRKFCTNIQYMVVSKMSLLSFLKNCGMFYRNKRLKHCQLDGSSLKRTYCETFWLWIHNVSIISTKKRHTCLSAWIFS